MDILYTIQDSGFEAKNLEELKQKVVDYYTVDGYTPNVTINGDVIHVHIDTELVEKIEKEFEIITSLCEQRKFDDAKPKLDEFIKKYPRHSEAYRISAQMKMEKGDIEAAIDTNIEALKCNPRNPWALLLMGNLFLKFNENLEVAQKYYDKLLEYCPDNYFAINNVASLMMERGEFDKAADFFKRVIDSGSKYINSYYGLAVCYYNQDQFKKSFEVALRGCKECSDRPENKSVMLELQKLLLADAQAITESTDYMSIVLSIKDIVEEKCGVPIKIEKDSTLKTSAVLQYGPTHHRNHHLIIYNDERPFTEHLIVHELMHLEMLSEASEAGKNMIVYHNNDNEIAFRTRYANWIKKMTAKIGHSKAIDISSQVLSGLMLQAMNCPLDLFVEERMFNKYVAIRPIQLLSLMALDHQNIESIKGSYKAKFIPQSILDVSKVLNVVSSMQLEHLYGIHFYSEYKATKAEMSLAKDMFEEYLAYSDYKPGEEYELVKYFSEQMNIEDFFSMMDEDNYQRDSFDRKEATDALRQMAQVDGADNPNEGNSFDGLSEEQKKRQDAFYEQNKDGADGGKTMMMAMYMLGALQEFDGMSKTKIGEIAFEIAMIGTHGISPEKTSGYKVSAFPNKDFSGYQLLAYYYVSWALAYPEKLAVLGLPFDTAWKEAQNLWNKRKNGN